MNKYLGRANSIKEELKTRKKINDIERLETE